MTQEQRNRLQAEAEQRGDAWGVRPGSRAWKLQEQRNAELSMQVELIESEWEIRRKRSIADMERLQQERDDALNSAGIWQKCFILAAALGLIGWMWVLTLAGGAR